VRPGGKAQSDKRFFVFFKIYPQGFYPLEKTDLFIFFIFICDLILLALYTAMHL